MRSTPRTAWVPALLWLVVIALESTSLGSADNTSRYLLPLLTFLLGSVSPLRYAQIHHCLRKTGHFFGYAVLSLFMFRAWWATLALRARQEGDGLSWRDMFRRWSAGAALLAVLSTAAVAGLDEWHQTMLAGRTGSILDVLLDSLGGVFTQMLLIVFSDVKPPRARPASGPPTSATVARDANA